MTTPQLALNYIDWLPGIGELFLVGKILLLPIAGVGALIAKRREKRGGLLPHETLADREPQALWVNHRMITGDGAQPSEIVTPPEFRPPAESLASHLPMHQPPAGPAPQR